MSAESPYLVHLTRRLADSLQRFPEEFRARHASYLKSLQLPEGGFPDRAGQPDLYYTAFGLRGLACLGALHEATARRAAAYLRDCTRGSTSIIDFLSLLMSRALLHEAGGGDVFEGSPEAWPDRVALTLESYRKPDGGYAKSTEAASGSTYHSFLVALAYELIGREIPRPMEMADFIRSRRREDGGFVEVGPARRGGTNPTAAAVTLLRLLGGLGHEILHPAAAFLSAMQGPDGGLRANARTPMADLLSSFTGLLVLMEIGEARRLNLPALENFACSVEIKSGGFRGGPWDDATDAEYTFYGLGLTALLPA